MITKTTFAASLTSLVLLASAASAIAAPTNELSVGDQTAQQVQPSSVKTRAQVVAELQQARAAGQSNTGELSDLGYAFNAADARNNAQLAHAGKTRSEVVSETRAAHADGSVVITGELSEPSPVRLAGTPRSRSEVRAEAVQSARNGYAVPTAIRGN